MIAVEAQDTMGSSCIDDNNSNTIIKGKRTKRQRPLSPLALTMASSSSCSSDHSGGATTSNELLAGDQSTEEEEDMANCLILLARGRHTNILHQHHTPPVTSSSATATKGGGRGLYVYECKTCNRCFPSFQALGGHRASHKKPKPLNNNNNMEAADRKGLVFVEADHHHHHHHHVDRFSQASTALSLQIPNRGLMGVNHNSSGQTKAHKLHECSICGSEFSSGQALGGHMRRHRTFLNTTTAATATATTSLSSGTRSSPESQESKKLRTINLQLDLNLPAPDDDRRETKFPFASKEQVIVFSASPLVDCHY